MASFFCKRGEPNTAPTPTSLEQRKQFRSSKYASSSNIFAPHRIERDRYKMQIKHIVESSRLMRRIAKIATGVAENATPLRVL